MRTLSLYLVLLISGFTYSQVGEVRTDLTITEVGKVERQIGGYFSLYTLSYTLLENGTKLYVLAFTNENTLYTDSGFDQRVFTFTATEAEFNYFHSFLMQGFKNDQIMSLEVGEVVISTLHPLSGFLHINVDFPDGKSAMFKLRKRQLDKLFGKK